MTLIAGPALKKLLTNDFVVEFFDGELVQQTDNTPMTYRGPGSISQDKDGQLQLKLFHKYSDSADRTRDVKTVFGSPGIAPGVIIDDRHYFSFKAHDAQGRTWTAEQVSVSGTIGLEAPGRVVSGELQAVTGELQHPPQYRGSSGKSAYHFVVPGAFKMHWNRPREQDGERFNVFSCQLFDEMSCEVRSYDDRLEIDLKGLQSTVDRQRAEVVVQALSFALGTNLRPVFERELTDVAITQTVWSRRKHAELIRLPPPITKHWSEDGANLLEFVSAFIAKIPDPESVLFGFWVRIYGSWGSDFENRALAVTTAIEGIIKEYFKDRRAPDHAFIEQVNAARPVVEALEIGERVKKRLIASLNGSTGATVKTALYALAKEGVLTDQQVRCWDDARNRAVHADVQGKRLDDLQKLLDDVHACVELFNRLVFHCIGYAGPFVQYATRGWPRSEVSIEDDVADDEEQDLPALAP